MVKLCVNSCARYRSRSSKNVFFRTARFLCNVGEGEYVPLPPPLLIECTCRHMPSAAHRPAFLHHRLHRHTLAWLSNHAFEVFATSLQSVASLIVDCCAVRPSHVRGTAHNFSLISFISLRPIVRYNVERSISQMSLSLRGVVMCEDLKRSAKKKESDFHVSKWNSPLSSFYGRK